MELRQKIHSLEIEKMECEYQIRQEVCREFQEQITDIEETHRSVGHSANRTTNSVVLISTLS